jgi:CRP-like cAMP-binding protein
MYIQKGGVKLSVLSKTGKEAIVAMLGAGDFLGEGALAGQPVRMGTATAVAKSTVLTIERQQMIHLLHNQPELSDRFIAYVLARNIRVEADLVDQLFNSSEKRLARKLLLLARYGKEDKPHRVLPRISQETLAEMVGTTRSRVNFFMNKFRKLGFIEYYGELRINDSLISVVLHD